MTTFHRDEAQLSRGVSDGPDLVTDVCPRVSAHLLGEVSVFKRVEEVFGDVVVFRSTQVSIFAVDSLGGIPPVLEVKAGARAWRASETLSSKPS